MLHFAVAVSVALCNRSLAGSLRISEPLQQIPDAISRFRVLPVTLANVKIISPQPDANYGIK